MKKIVIYFKQIFVGIKSSIVGLFITIKYFFKKKVTLEYPEKKEELPLSLRGVHRYNKNKCTACGICKMNCPVSCIEIEAEGKGKEADIKSYKIDYGKCLFCALCEENCPFKAIYLGSEFDLSTCIRKNTVIDFAKIPNKEKEGK